MGQLWAGKRPTALRGAGRRATELSCVFSLGRHKSLKNRGEEMVEERAARSREVSRAVGGGDSSHTGRWQMKQGTQFLLGQRTTSKPRLA